MFGGAPIVTTTTAIGVGDIVIRKQRFDHYLL